jgi:Helix-loop-helix DNA-binding domain
MGWYTSPTDSDGRRTSEISADSGYFDFCHSSTNTSPVQWDEFAPRSSPDAIPRSNRPSWQGHRASFPNGHPPAKRVSWHDATLATNNQQQHLLSPKHNAPAEVGASGPAPDRNTPLPSSLSPSFKHEASPEPNTKEIADHDKAENSRNGKRWKAAHRAVERRYRSNLNQKIIKLGQCIPTIRSQAISVEENETGEGYPTTSKAKLQKGHVLSKAVDYIQSLQQHVSELEAEKRQLESRVEALHLMVKDDFQNQQEATVCRQTQDLSRRFSEPHSSAGNSTQKRLCSSIRNDTVMATSSVPGVQNSIMPIQNGFSFVSENPSNGPKRQRPARGLATRLSTS